LTAPAPRLLGRHDDGRPGPTFVLVGGMHGNEPAGPAAIAAVLNRLGEKRAPLRGRVLGLLGNRAALAAGRRFLGRDLNRGWSRGEVKALFDPEARRTLPEDDEQRDMLRSIAPLLATAREPVIFLDLHTTSSDGPPFTCMADVLRNRPIGLSLPLPLILGIEEILDTTLLGYFCDLGHVALAVEGGRSDDPASIANHEAAAWLALVAAGALPGSALPDLALHRERLATAARGKPDVVEIRHRHVVHDDDGFVMRPGLTSFTPVRRGQPVADDLNGPVLCPEDGLMLMPRYQGQGSDGYFLARSVARGWLHLSSALRRARLDRLVPLLPGVRRDPEDPDRLLVDRGVARWQVVNVFHLFGYRHVRSQGEGVAFSRRRPGFRRLDALPSELMRLAGS
jgi:Succinylglutamate desuccinylase / Aspartoacylase family